MRPARPSGRLRRSLGDHPSGASNGVPGQVTASTSSQSKWAAAQARTRNVNMDMAAPCERTNHRARRRVRWADFDGDGERHGRSSGVRRRG